MTRQEAAEAVITLFDVWYAEVLRYAVRLARNVEVAEDAVQHSFLMMYRELCLGRAVDNPRAWTLVVARNEVLREMRYQSRYGDSLESAEALQASAVVQSLFSTELAAMLGKLSPREEEVVLLRLEGYKYREIAKELGISPNSVNTLLARALSKLQSGQRLQAGNERTAPEDDLQC